MIDFAWDRVRQGLPMPGLFVLRERGSISDVIETILFAAENSTPGDWQDLVTFVRFEPTARKAVRFAPSNPRSRLKNRAAQARPNR